MKMPCNNSDKNTDKEFYAEVARLLNVTVPTAKRYWIDGFYEVIVRMMYRSGGCRLPNLGNFFSVHEEEYFQSQKDPAHPKGEKILYKVPARDRPEFTPHDTFINDINNMAVTKAARKRVRRQQLTSSDFKRIQRASSLGDYGSITPDRVKKAEDSLLEKLEEKKKEKENGKT